MTRYNVRTFLDPRDDEGHLIARRVSEKRVAALSAASEASTGDDFFLIEVTEAPVSRFAIKRHPIDEPVRAPWALKDRARPAFISSHSTHERALRAADNIVRRERGMPDRLDISVDEIRAAMKPEHHGQHVQGCVSCYAYNDATHGSEATA